MTRRSEWRGIHTKTVRVTFDTKDKELDSCDIIFGGGAQDRQQELTIVDLLKKKHILKRMFDRGVPGLFVCGSPQLLGNWYMTGDGKKLPGLGIFDYVTRHFGHDKPRCIGDTAGELVVSGQLSVVGSRKTIVGFENHGGRTYLGEGTQPFARVKHGFGNNGEDGYEGAVYKNVIACYYHGPFLPKNPHVADWLITRALAVKYGGEIQLAPLDDTMEWQAHEWILKKMRVSL